MNILQINGQSCRQKDVSQLCDWLDDVVTGQALTVS